MVAAAVDGRVCRITDRNGASRTTAAVAGLRLGQHLRERTGTPDALVAQTIWLDCPATQGKARMIDRGAERDAPKLASVWNGVRIATIGERAAVCEGSTCTTQSILFAIGALKLG
ncbi:hypothetical protein [Nocardia sp. NPDC057440]|uniref:hypothetical protein n=1 Tax=Nocardia sp. NPDC057440 TaxID=3346134 RepID=UPI0036712605